MSKAVLMSIQPRFCELIADGKKSIEIRKTRPKLQTPFKVYIYCTNTPKYHHLYDLRPYNQSGEFKLGCVQHNSTSLVANNYINGKVIGEFVCDRIEQGHILWVKEQPEYYDKVEEKTQLTYHQMFDYLGESGIGYFWHITNLVIYDQPKELSEFCLTRPPQSWCYVEEIGERE